MEKPFLHPSIWRQPVFDRWDRYISDLVVYGHQKIKRNGSNILDHFNMCFRLLPDWGNHLVHD